MNLGELRALLITRSGRYDLVNSDESDNGANTFINAAQRFLDRKTGFLDETARYFETIDAGGFFVGFDNARTIDSVWAATSTKRWELSIASIEAIREYYNKPYGSVVQGETAYYGFTNLRSMPDSTVLDVLSGYATEIAVDGSQRSTMGIIVMPPTDEEIMIEVWGKFYSPTLTLDADTSYWTENNPEVLINATMYQLEVVNRNTEGMKDWLAAINIDTMGLEFDSVELESNSATQMEG